ncbi:hypothetical protein HG535_0D00240 [Zygotorulaspora mrakii]|uniref:Autophagy-related protein 2 n=1 Tax=Zygotorulaspora mrakii TaxID=42260 RepID=A0A7H9B1F9_ZYGMR|nr:uncharacterized protein HG535_0D00240 [Zygotorulaspora mrakii]QLG72317.1 hypothetical protein HG535_0D00240 [Zygotorulaspora mrakii]
MGLWLPQMIQKRLLLYVLQQISVLSNIDLSNLHVSLGSSSQFSFDDLNLAVDDIKIPYLSLRSGSIKHLEIELTVSGGVSICGKGVLFVVKPLIDDQDNDPNSFSLTKSIHDLTNSIIQYSESDKHSFSVYKDPESDGSTSPLADSTESTSSSGKESEPIIAVGALENMKNKILNVALSKLMVRFENIKFRFLLEENIIEASLGEIELNTEDNNIRKVEIHDFKVVCVKNSEPNDTEYLSDDNMSNSVLYSSKEASSIYMSALEGLKSPPDGQEDSILEDNELSLGLTAIEHISISFQGLSSLDDLALRDLKVKIQNASIDLESLLTMSDTTIGFVSRVFTTRKTEDVPQASNLKGYKRFQKEQGILEGFDNLAVDMNYLSVHFGEGVSMVFNNMNYTCWENREQTMLIDTMTLKGDGIDLQSSPAPILRAVLNSNEVEINILHSLILKVDKLALGKLAKVQHRLQEFSVRNIRPPPKKSHASSRYKEERVYKFCAKPITVLLNIGAYQLYLSTSEIFSRLPNDIIKIKNVTIGRRTEQKDHSMVTLDDLSIIASKSRMQLISFDENFKESSLTSKMLVRVREIAVSHEFEHLKRLFLDFQDIHSIIKINDKKPNVDKHKVFMKRSVRILKSSNIVYKKTDQALYSIILDNVDIKIRSFYNEHFGDLQTNISSILLAASMDGSFFGFCKDFLCKRNTASQQEVLASSITTEDIKKPLIFFQAKANGKIKTILREMSLHYYAKWLDFFSSKSNDSSSEKSNLQNSIPWELKMINCSIKLHPYRIKPCLAIIMEHIHLTGRTAMEQVKIVAKNGAILLIDDVQNIKFVEKRHYPSLVNFYVYQGFSEVGKIDSVSIQSKRVANATSAKIKANNIGLSLCADSAHTLVQLFMDLKIPITFPDDEKYSLTVPSAIDVFKHIDSDFFCSSHIKKNSDCYENDEEDLIHVDSSFLDDDTNNQHQQVMKENYTIDTSSESTSSNMRLQESYLDTTIREDHESLTELKEHIDIVIELEVAKMTIKLFDGYDWKFTRKSISQKIEEIDRELKKRSETTNSNERLEGAIFDSIYISGNPSDSVDLKKRVNDEIQGEFMSGLGSRKADLHPSRYYKALVELNQLGLIFTGYPMGTPTRSESAGTAEVLNKCEILVQSFDVIDNVPTSTWNKLLTILRHEQWPLDRPMLNMNVCLLRPVDFLAATELRFDIKLAPLRLHVDQDTLDFLVKFGEFKDMRFELIDKYPDIPFIQKLTTNSVKLKLDYKPKKVDYSGLRSGHTSELMNFFILDGANITLKGVALYGISGFSELNTILKSVWTPDITSRQLPGVLKGFAPVKSILALGSGARALVSVPLAEYKQDRRLGRSLKQGCNVFVRTATGDFVKLGARLASGTQTVLESTEEFFGGDGAQGRLFKYDDPLMDINGLLEEDQLVGGSNPTIKGRGPAALVIDPSKCNEGEPKIVSLYADQPLDLHKGLEEAYSSLEKHMHLVYDVIWKTQGEIKDSRSGTAAAAVSVAKVAPVAIIRPLIGATEAIAKALQGISNQLDKEQVNDLNDKYKSRSGKK